MVRSDPQTSSEARTSRIETVSSHRPGIRRSLLEIASFVCARPHIRIESMSSSLRRMYMYIIQSTGYLRRFSVWRRGRCNAQLYSGCISVYSRHIATDNEGPENTEPKVKGKNIGSTWGRSSLCVISRKLWTDNVLCAANILRREVYSFSFFFYSMYN